MPKKYLSSTYLSTAEDAPDPKENYVREECAISNDSDYKSLSNDMQNLLISSTSRLENNIQNSMNRNRLFIFPQSSPGFEVVYPVNENNVLEMNSQSSRNNSTSSRGIYIKIKFFQFILFIDFYVTYKLSSRLLYCS